MKKIVFTIALCLPFFAFSQQKNIYDTAADKICDYMNKHADTKITSEKEATTFFSEAFMDACAPLLDRLMEAEGVTSFDNQSGRKLGEKIGLKLAAMCPKYLEIMHPVIKAQIKDDGNTDTGTLKGTVTEVAQDNYTYLKLKTADGIQKRVVWLTAFDEAENFNNDPQKLVGKKIEVTWKAAQLFHFKSKSFSSEKVISGLKVN